MAKLVKQGFHSAPIHADRPGAGRARTVGEGARDGWAAAVALTERWVAARERVDALLEQLDPSLPPQERARAQHLFYGVVRWAGRLEAALDGLMARPPRTKVRAALLVAGFELLEAAGAGAPETAAPEAGAVAKIVHHAVERSKTELSLKEAGLVNAVARKLAGRLAEPPPTLATAYAHPAWLVTRWERLFGAEATRALLAWNQQPATVFARWRRADEPTPAFLAPTAWPGFFEVKAGHWPEVRQLAAAGALYLQDPSTRLCVDLLAPQAGESLLDACAAPGGKSLFLADTMKTGRITAVDLPAQAGESPARLDRLRENLTRVSRGVEVALMPADLTAVDGDFFRAYRLPERYDAVLLDAPCSNTGVMRHRVDVKWRLQETDFAQHARRQLAMLHAAARLVGPGGRLVYSTCSIDAEENERVLKAFFDSRAGSPFKLEAKVLSFPWMDGHDGAGVFRLRRS